MRPVYRGYAHDAVRVSPEGANVRPMSKCTLAQPLSLRGAIGVSYSYGCRTSMLNDVQLVPV